MTKPFVRRVKTLEHSQKGPDRHFPKWVVGKGGDSDLAQALREARLRAAAGDPIPETPITVEMMEDPVSGVFWRQMFKARRRVLLLRQ